ncbi:MAG: hypothetical protein M0T75_10060 [Chloroflexi bacterium]|nr:hypothetical protein [Chloroflexota bacterium]
MTVAAVGGGAVLLSPEICAVACPALVSVGGAAESALTGGGTPTSVAARAGRLATGADEAVFWSGIRGGPVAAADWVAENGGATLEMTLVRRGVHLPAWDAASQTSIDAWRSASAEFAAGAQGNVRVLQSDAIRVSSIWAEVEFPALTANPNVLSITAVDPVSGMEVLLWTR